MVYGALDGGGGGLPGRGMGLTLRAGVFNLTGEKYAEWGDVRCLASTAPGRDAYTQPGRNVSVSLTYDF
jgi:hemoglobin/transferrin/lactoferrin receptor protein